MDLNKDDVILLIQEYEKQRILWDAKDKWHFHKNKKNDAWETIARSLDIDVEDAKKKIASLLGSFRREKTKARKTMGTGKGAKDIYKSDWFAFTSFAFLMDKDDPRETINSEEINNVEANESDKSNEVIHDTTESQELESVEQNLESPELSLQRNNTSKNVSDSVQQESASRTFLKPSTPGRKRQKKTEKEDPRIEKAFQILQQPIPQEDSSTLYAKYLADRLNKFNPVTKTILMHKIEQVIFDAEMEQYRMQSSSPHYARDTSQSFTSPSPSPSFSSPASTPPFAGEALSSYTFTHEHSQKPNSETGSNSLQSQLEEFVYLTPLD